MGVHAVFLVGFMASGKTTVGQELARRMGWDFVDLDALIQSRENQTVSEIFRDGGEQGFRLAETAALRNLVTGSLKRDSVVALGGGCFAQEMNRELLREWPSIFLEASVSELWQRSLTDGIERPLRTDSEQFAELYQARLPFYRQATVTIVTTEKDPASICDEIQRNLLNWGNKYPHDSEISSISLETSSEIGDVQ
jgi:shikimate kinase